MGGMDEKVLQTAKEIVVKFIEVGRVSPTTFHETFREVYATVDAAVKGLPPDAEDDKDAKQP